MERIKPAELKRSLEEFLALTTMTLSTVGLDGEPHAAAVYFTADEAINLYYFSETSSQHAQDTDHDPRAAVAVHADVTDWRAIHGLQMRGKVRIVDAKPEWGAAWRLYRQKFPFVEGLAELIAVNQFYIFKPTWIRRVDNRLGFGYKQEWELYTNGGESDHAPNWRIIRNQDG